ncbi:MAG: transglutaminase domain-containing protein, partial [Thermodesulfobacteriota bacterium]
MRALGRLVEELRQAAGPAARRAVKDRIRQARSAIEAQDGELRRQFAATEQRLREKSVPAEILQRHLEFVAEYESGQRQFMAEVEALDQAATAGEEDQAIRQLQDRFEAAKRRVKRPRIDFNNLPHRAAEPTKAEPRLKKEDFQPVRQASTMSAEEAFAMLFPGTLLPEAGYHPVALPPGIRVASLGHESGGVDSGLGGEAVVADTEDASFGLSPGVLPPAAAVPPGGLLLAQLSDLPTPADLAPSVDVQVSPAIEAKAAELGHDPVRIYEWVRNSIEYAPTWGAIQGADYCLQSQLCNAFDTSSLLIALLHASDIPARYVLGTGEMAVERFMSWVGDFTDANAALTFARSGGIPLSGVVAGGKITRVQFEHVWVEAWIDYVPSRGARHRTGHGDTWVPLDASFKQHTYTQGLDLAAAVPFDAQAFADQIVATATIDQEQGSVTGVDQAFIEQTMADFQTRVASHLEANYPNATVGEVLGTRTIQTETYPYLLGTLPYQTVVAGVKSSELPASLRHSFSLRIEGKAPISYSASLPELAGKKITLSYAPATQADEDLISSFLPAAHADGTPITPEELPTSLPAYLIQLRPELRLDGQVVATGGAVTMGTTEDCHLTMTFPGKGAFPVHNTIEAGDYAAIALDLGRIAQAQLAAVKAKLETTKARLEAQDFAGLTRDDLLGDLLFTTAVGYYAEYDVLDYLSARTMQVNNLRLPSEALFANDLKFTYSFYSGRAISAQPGGLVMDVDFNTVVAQARDGNKATFLQFMRATGLTSSALEHAVPEQLFSTPENPAQGV